MRKFLAVLLATVLVATPVMASKSDIVEDCAILCVAYENAIGCDIIPIMSEYTETGKDFSVHVIANAYSNGNFDRIVDICHTVVNGESTLLTSDMVDREDMLAITYNGSIHWKVLDPELVANYCETLKRTQSK